MPKGKLNDMVNIAWGFAFLRDACGNCVHRRELVGKLGFPANGQLDSTDIFAEAAVVLEQHHLQCSLKHWFNNVRHQVPQARWKPENVRQGRCFQESLDVRQAIAFAIESVDHLCKRGEDEMQVFEHAH